MKFVSKNNLSYYTNKFKEWIKARKIKASDLDSTGATAGQVPTADGSGGVSYQTPQSGGITQQEADARYLQLSGGTMTGAIKIPIGNVFVDENDIPIFSFSKTQGTGTRVGSEEVPDIYLVTGANGNVKHLKGSQFLNILDTSNTSANPTLAGTEAALESLKLNGVNYKNQPSSMQILTTAPTADNTSGIKIVVLSSEPATKYNGFLYLIL